MKIIIIILLFCLASGGVLADDPSSMEPSSMGPAGPIVPDLPDETGNKAPEAGKPTMELPYKPAISTVEPSPLAGNPENNPDLSSKIQPAQVPPSIIPSLSPDIGGAPDPQW